MSELIMEANKQWATRPPDQRFQTLEALSLSVNNRRDRSLSADVMLDQVEVRADATGLVLTLGDMGPTPAVPTHWSFGQICSLLKAPADWLRKCPPELVVKNLEYAISKSEKDELKVLTIMEDDKPANTMQAVTSTKYGRIWDADVVSAVQKIVERTGGKFHNPLAYAHGEMGGEPVPSGLYASDRDCFMFMIDGGSKLECGERAELNKGFIVWNSEVGSRTFGMMTFLFNECCGNHYIWGAQDVNRLIIRHTESGPARFEKEAAQVLNEYAKAPFDTAVIERAQKLTLESILTVPDQKVLDPVWQKTFADKYGFTRGELREAIAIAEREEGKCVTLWDLTQGFTAHARRYDHMDTRLDLEMRAGKLLNLAT